MMATLRIPVRNGVFPYRMTIELDGALYGLLLRWNARDDHWYLDLEQARTIVLAGIKVVNSADLLAQFGHMQVDGRIPPGTFRVVDTVESTERDPDTVTLGAEVLLLYDEAA
jgi:hypothetical protein